EIADMWGIWPLALACEAGMAEIVRLLVSAGAQTNHASSIDGSTALNRGATLCRPEVVEILIQGGADVNLPDFDASTPLLNSACLDLRRATH
ncbi:ANKEF1, partial [Symbiodinium necroappetens]